MNVSLYCLQISDFGLARDLSGDGIYQSQGGSIPVKWTAPEVSRRRACDLGHFIVPLRVCMPGKLYAVQAVFK